MKTINNALIRTFHPCYDPAEKVKDENETLPVVKWVAKYRSAVPPQDIVWLLCRNHFLSDRDLRLFAVWCAREALSLVESPDPRSVAACDVAERYANGEASKEELQAAASYANAAYHAAYYAAAAYAAAAYAARAVAADAAAFYAASYANAAYHAASYADAAYHAAYYADADVARKKQIDKLLTYFV